MYYVIGEWLEHSNWQYLVKKNVSLKAYSVIYDPLIIIYFFNRFNIELVECYVEYCLYWIVFFNTIKYIVKIIKSTSTREVMIWNIQIILWEENLDMISYLEKFEWV